MAEFEPGQLFAMEALEVREPAIDVARCVLADNSYGRVERGSQLAFTDEATHVSAVTQLKGGTHASVQFPLEREHDSPLGLRVEGMGQLVKARLGNGEYLLFRALADYRVEQLATSAAALEGQRLVVARAPDG